MGEESLRRGHLGGSKDETAGKGSEDQEGASASFATMGRESDQEELIEMARLQAGVEGAQVRFLEDQEDEEDEEDFALSSTRSSEDRQSIVEEIFRGGKKKYLEASGAQEEIDLRSKIDRETVLVGDLREAFAKYWSDYWTKLGFTPVVIDGAHCYYNDIASFELRGVWWTHWEQCNIVAAHKEIARFYREKGGWFSWYLPKEEETEQFRQVLYHIGLEPLALYQGWHAGSMEYPFYAIDPKFKFVPVDDGKKLGIFMCMFAELRRYDASLSKQVRALFKSAGPRCGLQHFVGFYDGKPAGIISFVQNIDRVNLYDLYVREPFRRKGVGRYLLQECVAFAHLLKIEHSVILAPKESTSFLERCHFQPFAEYLFFAPRA